MSSTKEDSLYDYDPNKVLPIVGIAVFAGVTILHSWQAVRTKSLNYMWPFIAGLILEIGGYVLRQISVHKPESKGPYIIQQVLLVVAVSPAVIAASLYMSYGRCTIFTGEEYSPLRPRLVTKVFVTFDVFSFVIQGAGGGILGGDNTSKSKQNLGKAIIIAGFIIQVVAFSCFLVISYIFWRRAKRNIPYSRGLQLVPVLWITAVPILVRTIFRFVEYASSNNSGGENGGFLLDHEVFLWIFDALLIFLATLFFGVYHPSRYIPNDKALREADGSVPMNKVQHT
ncbi:RTA1 like protein [Atractiella rhizophila]|nr:RTA1 like protein [Atractiella rhizophila]